MDFPELMATVAPVDEFAGLDHTTADGRRARKRAVEQMTPVQKAVFESAVRGKDLVVQARTGTGKTAAFGLPLVDSIVRRNQQLVWTWDSLSLGLLLDWAPFDLTAVPTADGEIDVAVRAGDAITLDPWPFAAPRLTVRSEGRRLAGRFDDEASMREGLAAAPWAVLEFELTEPSLFVNYAPASAGDLADAALAHLAKAAGAEL